MTEPFGVISEPWWDDQSLWIVGGGPSLTGYDISGLRKRGRVLGINRAAELIPCDITFTLDHTFLKRNRRNLVQWGISGHDMFAAVADDWFKDNKPIPGVTYLLREQGTGVGNDPCVIINGHNSGYGALCLGILKRAQTIILLGFDFLSGRSGESRNHWHDGYPWGQGRTNIYYERWAKRFDEIAADVPPGIQVWNANPNSAVTAFPFKSYDELGIKQRAVSVVAI